jgi:hypothetical protein
MAKDELTYSEAVRVAAAEAAAALGTNPEAAQQRAIGARGQSGNGEARVCSTSMLKRTKRRLANGRSCSRQQPGR